MTVSTLLLFASVSFIAIVTPGPTVLLALTNGSAYGVRRSCWGMAGAVVSDFVLVAAVAVGLGALLAASEFWFSVVKWVGVGYLAWLGIRLLRSKGELELEGSREGAPGAGRDSRAIFMKSFLVAVTNPKGYLFVTAFLPQFIDASMPQVPQYVALAVVFALMDLAVMFGYALLGARVVHLLKQAGALWLNRVCGGALLALAGSLALYRKSNA